jgi:hypothetical protein
LAAQGSAADPISLLLNYGPVGVVALLLAAGLLVPKPAHQAALKERDDAKAALAASQALLIARQNDLVPRQDYQAIHDDLARLRTKLEDQMIPGVLSATSTLDRALQVLSRMAERAPV